MPLLLWIKDQNKELGVPLEYTQTHKGTGGILCGLQVLQLKPLHHIMSKWRILVPISESLYHLLFPMGNKVPRIHSHLCTGKCSEVQQNSWPPLPETIRYGRFSVRKHSHNIRVWIIFPCNKQGSKMGRIAPKAHHRRGISSIA